MAEMQTIIDRDLYQGHILDRLNELEASLRRMEVSGVEYSSLPGAIVTEVTQQTIGAINIIATDNSLKIGYDTNNYAKVSVNSGGGATLITVGQAAAAHLYITPQNNLFIGGGTTYFQGDDVQFSPAAPAAPFSLAPNGQGYTVTGLKADFLAKSVLAGDGLTTGGELVADVTIDLDTPGGLTYATTNVATGNHTHAIDSASSPGAAAKILNTDSEGSVSLKNLGINVAAPAEASNLRLVVSPNIRIQYDGSNFADLNTGATGNLVVTAEGGVFLQPTGNVEFSPATDDVLPGANYTVNLGAISQKFLTVHVAELVAETLVAAETRATLSGRVLIGSGSELTRDLGSDVGDTTIYVKHNGLENGDIIHLEGNLQVEFMKVTSAYTLEGEGDYSYTVTRDMDASGRNAWVAGAAVVNTGTTGDGFIDLFASAGVLGGSGPSIVGNYRTSNTSHNDVVEVWAIGNLNGFYGVATDAYGVGLGRYGTGFNNIVINPGSGILFNDYQTTVASWVGDVITLGPTAGEHALIQSTGIELKNSTNAYFSLVGTTITVGRSNYEQIKLDPTNGIRFFDAGGVVIGQLDASIWTVGWTAQDHVRISNGGIQIKDSSVVRGDWQTDGDIFIGSDVSAAATTYLSVFANAQTYNSEVVEAGDMLIGDNSASKANLFWDKSAGRLNFRGGTTTEAYIDTSGDFTLGGGNVTLNSDGITISSQGSTYASGPMSINFYDDSVNTIDLALITSLTFDAGADDYAMMVLQVTSDFTNGVNYSGHSDPMIVIEYNEYDLGNGSVNVRNAGFQVGVGHTFTDLAPMLADNFYLTGDLLMQGSIIESTAIACRVYRSTNVSISNGSWTTISWQAEDFDTGGLWAVSPNPSRITVPVAGYYYCVASVYLQAANSGTKRIRILKNGGAYSLTQMEAKDSSSKDVAFNTSIPLYFTAGQYIELQIYQDSGSATNLLGSVSATWMSLFRIA